MKPFDLQKALAGDPVVTRGGIKVLEIAYLKSAREGYRVIVVLDGITGNNTQNYLDDGRVVTFGKPEARPSKFDLLMAPKKKTVWVNVFASASLGEGQGLAHVYDTKELADDFALHPTRSTLFRFGDKAFPITYEE